MNRSTRGPLRRTFWQSLLYALSGLAYAVRAQRNFRIDIIFVGVVLGAVILFAALGKPVNLAEGVALTVTVGLVLFAELVNSVAEAIVDLLVEQYHEKARVAKDVAAGAVLITALVAIIVGAMIFLPRLVELLRE
ncbi:MAG: diacylglycerol kinase family protein [Deltaproteobacteria bacterium]|nr:diacylglycerol kinase family protein [Deltaproteobacteria bacterium]